MKNISALFDFYRFEGNDRLEKMINKTEAKYLRSSLDEDDLDMINAAGMIVDDFDPTLGIHR